MERVVVESPASSANLGPGFDVFAIALKEPKDRIVVESTPSTGRKIEVSTTAADVPGGLARNAAGAVVLSIAKKFRLNAAISVRVEKGVPIGIGLGSSGASSAGAAFAMNHLFDLQMDFAQLVAHSGEGERAASGAVHLDNVAASLLGGFVIVRQGGGPLRFRPPDSLSVVIVTPKVRLPKRKTEYARALIPKKVPTIDMVRNVSMASVVVAGFANRDTATIGEGMHDSVVEAARAKMVPGFEAVKDAAMKAGAAGTCMSGAGPSMLSFVDSGRTDPRGVLDSMILAFKSRRIEAGGFVTSIGEGAKVVESS